MWAARCREAGLAHAAIPMRRACDPRAAWRLARLIRAAAHPGRPRPQGPRPHARAAGRAHGRPARCSSSTAASASGSGACTASGYTSRRVHAIVAVCESIKDGLVAAGVPADKIEVIYSGTDLERFHPGVDGGPVRRELGLTAEHFADHPGRRALVARLDATCSTAMRARGRRLRPRAAALRGRAAAAHRRDRRAGARGRPRRPRAGARPPRRRAGDPHRLRRRRRRLVRRARHHRLDPRGAGVRAAGGRPPSSRACRSW